MRVIDMLAEEATQEEIVGALPNLQPQDGRVGIGEASRYLDS